MMSHRLKPGVTLIELVVVIALLGVMAGVVAPAFASLDRRSTDLTAVQRVESLVGFGRTMAIERAKSVDITIDPASRRFWIDPPDTAGLLELPAGSALVARAERIHVHIEPNGEAIIDERLSVRQGDSIVAIAVAR